MEATDEVHLDEVNIEMFEANNTKIVEKPDNVLRFEVSDRNSD